MPLEEEAERRGGRLPDATIAEIKREAIAAELVGGMHSPEAGGQGWTRTEWALVEEQYGRSTNAINWHVPNAYNVWEHASEDQVGALPATRSPRRGEGRLRRHGARHQARDRRDRGDRSAHATRGFRINAEKWFVTSGDVATVIVVMANLIEGDQRLADTVRRRP